MKMLNLATIIVRPLLIPVQKGSELHFQLIFVTAEEGKLVDKYLAIIPEKFFKGLADHFTRCHQVCKDIKTKNVFSDKHFKDFGIKMPDKEDIRKADYMG